MNNHRGGEIRRAIVALGANLGDPRQQLCCAMAALRNRFEQGFSASQVYRTAPVDMSADAGDFANAVVRFDTPLAPQDLMALLQSLEESSGRPKAHLRNTPRTLDLDLIALGEVRMVTPALTLPHPRAIDRRFVLIPLMEVAPDYRFPGETLDLEALTERAPELDVRLWD